MSPKSWKLWKSGGPPRRPVWVLAAAFGVVAVAAWAARSAPAASLAGATVVRLPTPPQGWTTRYVPGRTRWALQRANQACAFQEPYTVWVARPGHAWVPVVRGPSACTPAAWQRGALGPSGYPEAIGPGPAGTALLVMWSPAAGTLTVAQVNPSGAQAFWSLPAGGTGLSAVRLREMHAGSGVWQLRFTVEGPSPAHWRVILHHTRVGGWTAAPHLQGTSEQLTLPNGAVVSAGGASAAWQGDSVSCQVVAVPAKSPTGLATVGNHSAILQQGDRTVAGHRMYTALVESTPPAAAAHHAPTYAWWVVQYRPLPGSATRDLAYAVVIEVPSARTPWPSWASAALAHWAVGT